MPRLSREEIEKNFAEMQPRMFDAEALAEAARCLYCYDAPCTKACPTHIEVPSFIKKIATGNLTGAARVIFDANPIGATCARVCPVEVLCEGACVENTLLNKPIEIGRLQRYATDHLLRSDRPLFSAGEPNGLSVGIIGSGPAGLSCAFYLLRLGYRVSIYDKRKDPGGLDTYAMAEYKMTRDISIAEAKRIRQMGAVFHLDTEVVETKDLADAGGGARVKYAELKRQHDAIFLAIGLGATRRINIPGEHLSGVTDALRFIEMVKTRHWDLVPVGRFVAVIGAGNTAIDAATQAKRLGAERVFMIYRRTPDEMPAYNYEFELAKQDGIEFIWQTRPIAITGDGRVEALKCEKTDGTATTFDVECDQVITAIGQERLAVFFKNVAGVEVDDVGRVRVNEMMQTSDPKVFAGGDCTTGGGEAVEAAQMGKIAAQGIHFELTGQKVWFAGLGSIEK
ncbi:MAG: dihydropyrimidine dehydrogenase [Blastocatellia bacterium]